MAKLVNRMVEALDGYLRKEFPDVVIRGASASADDPSEGGKYRRLSAAQRDLTPLAFDRAAKGSFYLWQRNPLAKRFVSILTEFSVGDDFAVAVPIKTVDKDGMKTDTKRRDAQFIWDEFWNDPVNRLEQDIGMLVEDFFLNGELLLKQTTMNRQTGGGMIGQGKVRIVYLDPFNITRTIPGSDCRNIKTVVMKGSGGAEEIPFDVITVGMDPKDSATYDKLIGEVFYWRINYTGSQSRGHGFLVDILDWLDALDQFLFDALDGFRLRNSFFYDLELTGMKEEDVEKKAKEVRAPANGSVRVHNEKAKWAVVTPDLKSVDVDAALMSFQAFIVGNKGFPIHWFGRGSETNLATAEAMAEPTLQMLKKSQKVVRSIIKDMVNFVIAKAVESGRLKLAENEVIEPVVTMFDLKRKDASTVSNAFAQLIGALKNAVDSGWTSETTAKQVVDAMIRQLGVDVPDDETVESLKDERAKNDQTDDEDVYRKNPPPAPGQEPPPKPVAPIQPVAPTQED